MQITATFHFAAGHRLYQHQGACKNIHGHNYELQITVKQSYDQSSDRNELGVVIDFKDLKQLVSCFINENLDHALILFVGDPLSNFLRSSAETKDLKIFTMESNPTAENMLDFFIKHLRLKLLPLGILLVSGRLYETNGCFAEVINAI